MRRRGATVTVHRAAVTDGCGGAETGHAISAGAVRADIEAGGVGVAAVVDLVVVEEVLEIIDTLLLVGGTTGWSQSYLGRTQYALFTLTRESHPGMSGLRPAFTSRNRSVAIWLVIHIVEHKSPATATYHSVQPSVVPVGTVDPAGGGRPGTC